MKLIALLAVVLSAATLAQAGPTCSLGSPERCGNTNELVWSPGFSNAVKRFIGPAPGGRIGGQNAAEVILSALGGPPDNREELGGGGYLFSACASHDCPVKGALLLDRNNRIRGAGVFDFLCQPAGGCSDRPRLTLFLRDGADPSAQALFAAWAHWVIARDLFSFPRTATREVSGVKVLPAANR